MSNNTGKWPRDANTEMLTKMVAARAVNLSIVPFYTEFRCDHFCDDKLFWWKLSIRVGKSTMGAKRSSNSAKKRSIWIGFGRTLPGRYRPTKLHTILDRTKFLVKRNPDEARISPDKPKYRPDKPK